MKLVKEKKLKFHLELLDCDNTMISLTFHFCIPVHLEFNASLFILNPNFSFLSSPFTSIRRLHHHFFGPLTLLSFPFSLIFFLISCLVYYISIALLMQQTVLCYGYKYQPEIGIYKPVRDFNHASRGSCPTGISIRMVPFPELQNLRCCLQSVMEELPASPLPTNGILTVSTRKLEIKVSSLLLWQGCLKFPFRLWVLVLGSSQKAFLIRSTRRGVHFHII